MDGARTVVTRALPLLVAAVLALLGVTAVVTWWACQPPADVGQPLTAPAPSPPAVHQLASAPAPARTATSIRAVEAAGSLPTASARPAAPVAPAPVVPPVSLGAPGRLIGDGGEIQVVPVGVNPGGAMDLPADGDVVGWYSFGPAPGDPQGAAVLAGHVDTWDQGPGALYGLRELEVGDRLEVGLADGRRAAYAVESRTTVGKAELPVDVIFADDGPPRLVLITCGGQWREDVRGYTDNVVVVAQALP